MKKIFAMTTAAALMIATGAWAADTGGMRDDAAPTVGGGDTKSTLGSAGAPGATGSKGGSSTDSNPTTGGTGQPGTGIRQNLGETAPATTGTAGDDTGTGSGTHPAVGGGSH